VWAFSFFELSEDFPMAKKPSHEELEQRVKKLEKELGKLKQSEKELRKSEQSYRYLVENASDIIYKTDAMGHFTFMNPISANTTGYSQEDLYGRHFLDLIRPDYHQGHREILHVTVQVKGPQYLL
jgi:PAS domain-containing protein